MVYLSAEVAEGFGGAVSGGMHAVADAVRGFVNAVGDGFHFYVSEFRGGRM